MSHRKVKQNDNLSPVQDSGSLAVFKVTARDQGHFKGPSGAFVTYCNISCFQWQKTGLYHVQFERTGMVSLMYLNNAEYTISLNGCTYVHEYAVCIVVPNM